MAALAACGGGNDTVPVGAAPAPVPAPAVNPQPTAVGTPAGAAVTQTIGPAGGTLASADGAVTLVVAPGALAADTTIGIQPITNFAIGGTGPAYRLTPEGTTLAQPVTLSFAYDDTLTAGSAPQALEIATQDAQGYWQRVRNPTRDLNAKTISATIPHFSDWSRIEGVQLLPHQAAVRIGQAQDLSVVACVDSDETELTNPLGRYDCSSELASPTPVHNWAVNGAPGGTTGTGLVSGDGKTGRYTAPSVIPNPNTVSVSAETSNVRYGRLTLVSNLAIVGNDYVGTADLTAGDHGGTYGVQHLELTWTPVTPNPLVGLGGVLYRIGSGYWTTTVTPSGGCDPQTVTADIDTNIRQTFLEVYGGSSPLAGKYRFQINTQPLPVTFTCHGVPAPTVVQELIDVEGCPVDPNTLAGAPTSADPNTLTGSAPAYCNAQGITATWSFNAH